MKITWFGDDGEMASKLHLLDYSSNTIWQIDMKENHSCLEEFLCLKQIKTIFVFFTSGCRVRKGQSK